EDPLTCPTDPNPYEWECQTENGAGNINNWGTGARCVKIKASKVTVQSNNAQGRAFCVNGNEAEISENNIMTKEYSAADDGYITVCATAGDNSYTQIGWYNCKKPAAQITFDCTASNSTNMTGSNFVMTAGQCYKRTCSSNGDKWHLTGPQGAKLMYEDCSGNVNTHVFSSDWQWWPTFNIGECTAYFKMDQGGQSDNCW
ncbi:MAG: hypothetical protein II835_14960, partial [Fibrobacter sp.]|nr:hypothetical protein [Fibrobacter sp.]